METPIHECARSGNNDILLALLESIPPTKLQATVNKRSSVRSRSELYTAHAQQHILIEGKYRRALGSRSAFLRVLLSSRIEKAEDNKIETPFPQNKFSKTRNELIRRVVQYPDKFMHSIVSYIST